MTSSQHGPYILGLTRATMARTMGCQPARGSESYQNWSQFGLQPAIRTESEFAGIGSPSRVGYPLSRPL